MTLPPSHAIRIASIDDARIAMRAAHDVALPLVLISPPGAGQGGVGYFKEVLRRACAEYPEVQMTPVIDCGGDPGVAMAAIRADFVLVHFVGDIEYVVQIDSAAMDKGGMLIHALDVFDLRGAKDGAPAREFLKNHAGAAQ